MKYRKLIGMVLILMISLLAGCGMLVVIDTEAPLNFGVLINPMQAAATAMAEDGGSDIFDPIYITFGPSPTGTEPTSTPIVSSFN